MTGTYGSQVLKGTENLRRFEASRVDRLAILLERISKITALYSPRFSLSLSKDGLYNLPRNFNRVVRRYSLLQKTIGVASKLYGMGSNLGRVLIENPKCLTYKSDYVFILSHMRSRSSVLSHILGSNDDICGYRELHHSYRIPLDLLKLKSDLYQDFGSEFRRKMLLDKVLHNNNGISRSILTADTTRIVFLVREPESTLKSIVMMGIQNNIPGYDNVQYITSYYCQRVEQLAKYAEILKGNYFFIASDRLLEEAEEVLDGLGAWLGLQTALSPYYKTFDRTGTPVAGDPSDNIKSGKLIKTKGAPDIEIPPEYLNRAREAYKKCIAVLTRNP